MEDVLLYEIESNNPRYVKIVAREGTKPSKPPNSVVLKRFPNPNAGSMIEVYGILNPNFNPLDEEKKVKPPPPPALITVKQEKGPNLGEALTVPSLVYQEPKTPLDTLRKQARQNNAVYMNFPSLVGKKLGGEDTPIENKIANDAKLEPGEKEGFANNTGEMDPKWMIVIAVLFIVMVITFIVAIIHFKLYQKFPWTFPSS